MMERCPLCDHPYEGHKGIFADEESYITVIDGEVIRLTHRLSQVLAGILKCDPRIASFGYLMDYIYGLENDSEPSNDILKVYVYKIRKKISHTRFEIKTVWGKGFRIVEIKDGTKR